eukprot:767556-Hanusia_phi.AAC.3
MSSVDGDGVSELLFGAENETRISSEIFRGASEKHGIVKVHEAKSVWRTLVFIPVQDLGIHNGTRLLIKNNGNVAWRGLCGLGARDGGAGTCSQLWQVPVHHTGELA